VAVLDGAGQELICQVLEADRRQVSLKVLQRNVSLPNPFQLTLAQAMIKGKNMDLVVQKATELGVQWFAPIICERSVAHSDGENASAKVEKWRATAIESIKQCGSPWLPQITPPQTAPMFLAGSGRFEMSFVASFQKEARHPREYISGFLAAHQRLPRSVCVWVGPEGDFTPAELNAFQRSGVLPITLGKLVLRSETAAICCLSVLRYEMEAPAANRAKG
jgi:16S rRNA (uracil1498-N3)-methyltransferase